MSSFARILPFTLCLVTGSAAADDRSDVLAANSKYEQAFSTLEINVIEETWAHDGNVTVIHPSSKAVLVGWDAVRKSYANQPARHKDFSVTMQEPQVAVLGNVAWVTGVEKFTRSLELVWMAADIRVNPAPGKKLAQNLP